MKKLIIILLITSSSFYLSSCEETYIVSSIGNISINSINPQPAKEEITVYFTVLQSTKIIGTLENLTGIVVKNIIEGMFVPGYYSLDLDVRFLGNGLYIIKFKSGGVIYKEIFEVKK